MNANLYIKVKFRFLGFDIGQVKKRITFALSTNGVTYTVSDFGDFPSTAVHSIFNDRGVTVKGEW